MFGWSRIFTLAAVAAAVAVVTGGAGATSTSTRAPATVSHAATAGKISTAASRSGALLKTASVSTRAGAARYLRAIGVDPRGLVFQRGARNVRGPELPGSGLGMHVDGASCRADRARRRQEHLLLHKRRSASSCS